MMMKNILFILFFIFWLTSCVNLSPIKTEKSNLYVINASRQPTITKSSHPISLYVAPVESNYIYSTSAMVYSIRPYQVDYFVKNRWAAPPAKMLYPLMIQTLQKTHYFAAVSGSSMGRYNFVLSTQLNKLQQQFLPHSSFVTIVLQAKLMSLSTNQVIAFKQFSITERAPESTPYGGVVATNRATSQLLSSIASFCVQNLEKQPN